MDFSNIFTHHPDIDDTSEIVTMKDLVNSGFLRPRHGHDILNMEIIYDDEQQQQNQSQNSFVKIENQNENQVPKKEAEEEDTIVPDQNEAVEMDVEENEEQTDEEEEEEDDDDLKDESLNPLEGVDISSLVVLKTNDSKDPKNCSYKVYAMNSETGLIDEDKPLDLPEDVIQLIVESMIV